MGFLPTGRWTGDFAADAHPVPATPPRHHALWMSAPGCQSRARPRSYSMGDEVATAPEEHRSGRHDEGAVHGRIQPRTRPAGRRSRGSACGRRPHPRDVAASVVRPCHVRRVRGVLGPWLVRSPFQPMTAAAVSSTAPAMWTAPIPAASASSPPRTRDARRPSCHSMSNATNTRQLVDAGPPRRWWALAALVVAGADRRHCLGRAGRTIYYGGS
jgi:hypothetical protein